MAFLDLVPLLCRDQTYCSGDDCQHAERMYQPQPGDQDKTAEGNADDPAQRVERHDCTDIPPDPAGADAQA